jgi:hypothetical protein
LEFSNARQRAFSNNASTIIMQNTIKNVQPLKDYVVQITLDNNEIRLLDMKPYLNFGVFNKIKDKAIFNSVRLSFDTIEWNGNIDLSPEFVYNKSVKYYN